MSSLQGLTDVGLMDLRVADVSVEVEEDRRSMYDCRASSV